MRCQKPPPIWARRRWVDPAGDRLAALACAWYRESARCLSFVLAVLGSLAESKLMGGQAVIVIADEVETAFTYGPGLAAKARSLAMTLDRDHPALMAIFLRLRGIDLDLIMGKRR